MDRKTIRTWNKDAGRVFIVLDDDPTGCQTVHGIDIYFQWDFPTLERAIRKGKDFFILTNSRALPEDESVDLHNRLLAEIRQISQREQQPVAFISRSDSTLRGHFYPEIKAIETITGPYDGIVFCPYFREGNRLTKEDTHYIVQDNHWMPAHESEFAEDEAFGYTTAYLPDWIEEKSKGKISSADVLCISLEDIREGGVEAVYRKLRRVTNLQPVVINAISDTDLEVVVLALLKAEQEGKRFIDRSAASWVKIRLGIDDHPLLTVGAKKAGIIVAGSYVNKTTRQLNALIDRSDVIPLEAVINKILADNNTLYFNEMQKFVYNCLSENKSVVIFTSRDYAATKQAKTSLERGKQIMDFLCRLVNSLSIQPGFIISKGGITSNEIARRGAGIKSGKVLGQVHPGVPIIQAASDSKFPGMPYVIFPGNVGHDNSLLEVYTAIKK